MKLWRRMGYAHMNEYLERELGYATLPQIEARLTDGGLPYSAVRELTRVATHCSIPPKSLISRIRKGAHCEAQGLWSAA